MFQQNPLFNMIIKEWSRTKHALRFCVGQLASTWLLHWSRGLLPFRSPQYLAFTGPNRRHLRNSSLLRKQHEHGQKDVEITTDKVFSSLHEAALRPGMVQRLDLVASPQLRCNNLLCDEVGGPCICRFSRWASSLGVPLFSLEFC